MAMHLFCPENLDLDAIIEAHPLGYDMKRDYLLYILHSIIQETVHNDPNRWVSKGKRPGFVPLNAKELEKKVPRYRPHLDYLLRMGVIECDNHYIREVVSTGYRLTPLYSGVRCKRVEVRDFILCKKIRKGALEMTEEVKRWYPYMLKWFQSGKLQIDRLAALRWIRGRQEQEIDELDNSHETEAQNLEASTAIKEKYHSYRQLVERIAVCDYFHSVDETGHRLHTNLTNLPWQLRDYLTYDGQPLVSVDIRNSQPYMSTAIFNPKFWQPYTFEGYPALGVVHKELYRRMRQEDPHLLYTIMFVHSPETPACIDFPKYVYIYNVFTGTIYEHLQEVFERRGHSLGDNPDEKRARIKKLVLTLLFDDDDEIYNRQEDSAVNIFRREFPSIARAFSYIKSFGYNNLAILLQRIESFLLLGFVCRRISVQRPELPLFTIHDSIVTTAGNEGYIQAVMHEELYRIMGAAPQFKVEYWKRPIPVVELIVQRVSYLTWLELYRA